MKIFELRIIAKEILNGGTRLWSIQTKERFYNGRIRLLVISVILLALSLFYPIISLLITILLVAIVLIDFIITFLKYSQLAQEHRSYAKELYYLEVNANGFSHKFFKDGEAFTTNLWESYDYLIDDTKREILFLIDKNGGANLFFKSWMLDEDFFELKEEAYRNIKRKLNDRFI